MSYFYGLVCHKHKQITWATKNGYHCADSDVFLPKFIYEHCECEIEIKGEDKIEQLEDNGYYLMRI